MSREKDLVKNTFILSIGKFLPKLTSFVTLPVLTACLTKAEYGTYDLIATLVMLVIPVATMQIQSAAFRFLIDCRGDKKASSEVISNIFVVTLPVTILCSFIIQFFFARFSLAVRILIIVYFLLDTLYLTIGQITRGLGNNKAYSVASITLSVVYMAGVVLFVYFRNAGLRGVMEALSVAQVAGILYLTVQCRLDSYLSFRYVSAAKIKELLAYSWPMVPNNLSSWVLKLSDRLVITAVLGVEANAVYAVANKIPNLLSIAQSIMVMAWQENASLAAGDADAEDYYTSMLDRVFSLMFGYTVLLIAATPILFKILIKGDYAEAYFQMPVLILAMFFFMMSSYFGGIYIAHKRTVNVGISTMVAAGVNLLIDLLFVRLIGIWAGSISTLAAYTLLYFYRMVNCQSFQPIRINMKKQMGLILIMVVLLISCFMQNFVLNIVNIIAAVACFTIFNREIVVRSFELVMKKIRRK